MIITQVGHRLKCRRQNIAGPAPSPAPAPAPPSGRFVSPTGTGTWADSTNIATPTDPVTAMLNAVAGDTVYFRGGTPYELYYDEAQSPTYYYKRGILNPANSGTPGNPIIFRGYPGETVVMNGHSSAVLGITNIAYVFGNGLQDYVEFNNFTIQGENKAVFGAVLLDGTSTSVRSIGCAFRNNIFEGSTNPITDTQNKQGAYINSTTNPIIENCLFRDYRETTNYQNTSAYKGYSTDGLIIRHCEFTNCSRALFLKDNHDNFTIDSNFMHDNNENIYVTMQAGTNSNSTGRITNNLLINPGLHNISIEHNTWFNDDITIDNNTIYGGSATGYGIGAHEANAGHGFTIYNNIIQGHANKQLVFGYANCNILACDHNQLGTSSLLITVRQYEINQATYASVAAWQASGELEGAGNPGVGSLASDPVFVNAAAGTIAGFALNAGSPCIGAGRSGANMGMNGIVGIQ